MFDDFKINEDSGVPVWMQIRNYILFLIKSGDLKPGDTLPSVREFAVQIGVNYNTIHKVYQDLDTDGYVISKRGKRSTIAPIDRSEMNLPSSPVDVIIQELVRTVRNSGMTDEDALTRIKAALAASKED